jgi:hypothetical protein
LATGHFTGNAKLKSQLNWSEVKNMATLEQIIDEARALSPSEKQKLLQALDRELDQVGPADLDSREETFVNRLRQKRLVTEVPLRLPDDELRRNYKRIEVKGEPLSETIVKERI